MHVSSAPIHTLILIISSLTRSSLTRSLTLAPAAQFHASVQSFRMLIRNCHPGTDIVLFMAWAYDRLGHISLVVMVVVVTMVMVVMVVVMVVEMVVMMVVVMVTVMVVMMVG